MQRQALRDLPADKNPTGTRCIQITIPDDDEWEQAAYSELYRLALWMLWARDADKSGAPVAARWLKALDTWRHCDGSPSPIITSGDFDMSELCELLRWHNGKLQGWCCGEWTDIPNDGTAPYPGAGGQPDTGARPPAGQSACYPVLLPANKSWLLPFAVASGDTITISDIKGAWSNGGSTGWTCPDGTPFVFGACIGSKYHLIGDPDPTLFHGQLAVLLNGVYYSATGGAFTVPGGVANGSLTLVGNFEQNGPAGGELTFQICVTNGGSIPTTDWCAELDFTLSDFGFVPYSGNFGNAVWIPGTGWSTTGGTPDKLEMVYTFASARLIRATSQYSGYKTALGGGSGAYMGGPSGGAVVQVNPVPAGNYVASGGGTDQTLSALNINIGGVADGPITVTHAVIRGSGTIPVGWTAC